MAETCAGVVEGLLLLCKSCTGDGSNALSMKTSVRRIAEDNVFVWEGVEGEVADQAAAFLSCLLPDSQAITWRTLPVSSLRYWTFMESHDFPFGRRSTHLLLGLDAVS